MSLESLLLELKKEYIANLPSRISNIQKHFAALDYSALQDEFHKLKGTGKTYGLPEVSQLCEQGERICRDKRANITEALPLLVELLTAIHEKRCHEESFDLFPDPRFCKLRTLR